MKDWVISVCAVVLITTMITLILPSGKLGKFIKSIFSLVVVLVVLQPILKVDYDDIVFDFENYNTEVALQENYLSHVNQLSIKQIETNCEELLEFYGVKRADVNVDYTIGENRQIKYLKVYINLENAVIISEKEHIDIIDEIKKIISEYLQINKTDLVIYGK